MCLNTDLGAAAQPREQPVGDAKVLLLPAVSAANIHRGFHCVQLSCGPLTTGMPLNRE